MKQIALILLAFLIGCGSPTEPTEPGFTSDSVPGEYTYKGVFSVRLTGKYVEYDPYGGSSFKRNRGTITVTGDQITFFVENPFHVEPSDVVYFQGTIGSDKIVGKYWTNYDSYKMNMILVRTK
jgi:hypothetical protein